MKLMIFDMFKATKILPLHNRYTIDFIRGDGAYLFDSNGKKYIDFHGGVAVNILGHNDSDVNNVAIQQIQNGIVHLSNTFYHQQTVKLAEKLCKLSFADMVYFLNSGTEVVEMAIKICRKYYHTTKKKKNHNGEKFFQDNPNIPHIISLKNSFHGRTMGSVSLQNKYTNGFEPILAGFSQGEINNIESIKQQIYDNTVAIFIELIQGEGGVIQCNTDFVLQLKNICDELDIILVFDEIQTGIGRTGHLYAYQHYNIEPNILLSAKGLGNGFPIGAILLDDKTSKIMTIGDHGTTFGGNILASTVANTVVDKVNKPENLKYISEIGLYLKNTLIKTTRDLTGVKEVRGIGLLVAIEMSDSFNMEGLRQELSNRGLLVMTTGQIIRILPSLKITKRDIDEASIIIRLAIQAISTDMPPESL